ncbi:MAG: DNA polymerase/3'-5' exonuclease PolX [Anaerolineae bacterium]
MGEVFQAGKAFTNKQVSDILDEIANMLEIKGEIRYKFLAYRRAAENVRSLGRPVVDVWRDEDLRDIPGIGEGIAKKLDELFRTGRLEYHEKLKDEIPPGVVEMLNIPDVGPRTAKLMYEQLGLTSVAQVEEAAQAGKLRALPGLGERSEQKILEGIAMLKRRTGRLLLGVALPLAQDILSALRERCPSVVEATVAGSLRRMRETVGDIDLLVTATEPLRVIETFKRLPHVAEVMLAGPTKCTILTEDGLQVDLRVLEGERYGSLLQYFTGSQEHNVALRELAQRQGLSLSEYGFKRDGEEILCPHEEEVYAALGLPWIPPELREARGEIEAAQQGQLPNLVELAHIRGDLQVHTTWSDGVNRVEEMALAARARGYQYILITDHTRGLGVTGGLDAARLMEQRREIDAVNAQFSDFWVLHGTEVEIKGDGSLDLPDQVLAELDVVVASVHSGLRQSQEKMTGRMVKALRNPHVDILGHPTGRIIGQREASAVDLETVLKTAAETGTALEVNAGPDRLDLDDIHIRRAIGMGIKLAINSDAHNTDGLANMPYGVATARRGWAEAKDILNTLSVDQLLEFVKK